MPLKHLEAAFPVVGMLVSRKLVNYRKLYPEVAPPFLRTGQVLLSGKPSDSQIPIESPLQSGCPPVHHNTRRTADRWSWDLALRVYEGRA